MSESSFELPIYFSDNRSKLSDNIINDLELVKTVDLSLSSMYSIMLQPSTCFGKEVLPKFAEHYTTDIPFLKDTQKFLTRYQHCLKTETHENMSQMWMDLKKETGFCEKYLYIDWEMGKFLNTHSSFLQVMSIYNITSPIISFCLPIIILIVPFFVINAKGLNISTSEYIAVLKKMMEHHAVGKLFLDFDQTTLSQKAYILCSTALYMFSIYQNMLVCLRFYRNIIKINDTLKLFKQYVSDSIETFESYLSQTNELTTYSEFNKNVRENCDHLINYKTQLNHLGSLDYSWKNLFNIGDRMKFFYHLFDSKECNQVIQFSFNMHGYLDNMNGLISKINNADIHLATIRREKEDKTVFKKAYYPPLMGSVHVKNTCDFSKSIVLSGPNASGKTTILKTSILNVLFTQQFGCGCYEEATLVPYKYIHCYLNIPDTSGRDSLFQAEARRCKDIIDSIDENPEERHFCAFDELYSGTNPEDATASSLAFMNYISKNKNVSSILTTHYYKVCRKLAKNKRIQNYNMKTISDENNAFSYTYQLVKGISEIKGGIKVLKELNYPTLITENIR